MPRDVFISYSQSDRECALELTARLEADGLSVWIAPRDVSPAADWASEILEALSAARVMVLLLSASSNISPQVRREVERAVHKQRPILPVRIEEVLPAASLEYFLSTQQWLDAFPPPREPHFARLCSHLKSLLSLEGTTATAAVIAAASASPGAPRPASVPRPATEPSARQRAGTPSLERSIAVLPFANLSSDPEQEYFSDGLTEELINQLAHIKGLRVVARTSCFVFKGRREDLRLVGEKLAVGRVLEGSVRKAGKRLRITAQLIDCADGYHLWSETFDRELEDVFAIQDDIARAVAGALGSVLTTGSPATAGGTQNVEAYELSLRAAALMRGQTTPAAIERSAALYREALALDPRFALAWAGLAQAMVWAMLYVPETARQAQAQMDQAIEHAIALAPDLWANQVVICQRETYRHHWQAADAAARRALALAPGSDADGFIGRYLLSVGRATEALTLCRAARATDPLSGSASIALQIALTILGHDEEADAEYRRSEDLVGQRHVAEHTALLRAWSRGAPPATLREHLRRYQDPVQMPVEAELPGLIEQPEKARQRLRRAFDDPAYQDSTRQFRLAVWAALFGDVDLALAALRRAYIDLQSWTSMLIWLPIYRPMRADPRFKQLLRDLGLVDYWRASGNWGEFARPVGAEDFEVI